MFYFHIFLWHKCHCRSLKRMFVIDEDSVWSIDAYRGEFQANELSIDNNVKIEHLIPTLASRHTNNDHFFIPSSFNTRSQKMLTHRTSDCILSVFIRTKDTGIHINKVWNKTNKRDFQLRSLMFPYIKRVLEIFIGSYEFERD